MGKEERPMKNNRFEGEVSIFFDFMKSKNKE